MLICPVCKQKLNMADSSFICQNNHSFDISKDGYVNLLLGSKNGNKRGDSKESARARREFLEKDYYVSLKNTINKKLKGKVLDICCGEGYYDDYNGELFGFDISKEMVRLASKKHKNNSYFVANLSNIPIEDSSIDTAMHLFAPFNEKEFNRVLKKGSHLYSVIPGKEHLYELKKVVYDSPYYNDEEPPKTNKLKLINKEIVTDTVNLNTDELKTLFSMTPYFYRTSEEDKSKIDNVNFLDLTVQFVILDYLKED